MKKIFLAIALIAFLGNVIAPTFATNTTSKVVVVDNEKCTKCGKEGCDGKCDAKKCDPKKCDGTKCNHGKDGKGCDKAAKGGKCCPGKGEAAGCAKKCPHAGNTTGGGCQHGKATTTEEKTPVPNK